MGGPAAAVTDALGSTLSALERFDRELSSSGDEAAVRAALNAVADALAATEAAAESSAEARATVPAAALRGAGNWDAVSADALAGALDAHNAARHQAAHLNELADLVLKGLDGAA